jgi:hypothetical protein
LTPTQAATTSYFGRISTTENTLFSFDIPASTSGKTCNLIFLLPQHADLKTSDYNFTLANPSSSEGSFNFASLLSSPEQGVTWNSSPTVKDDFGTTEVKAGGKYAIWSGSCPAGQRVGYEVWTCDGSELNWFEDYNPAA